MIRKNVILVENTTVWIFFLKEILSKHNPLCSLFKASMGQIGLDFLWGNQSLHVHLNHHIFNATILASNGPLTIAQKSMF